MGVAGFPLSAKNMGSNASRVAAADVLGQFHLSGISVGSFLRSFGRLVGCPRLPLYFSSLSFLQSKILMIFKDGRTKKDDFTTNYRGALHEIGRFETYLQKVRIWENRGLLHKIVRFV